MTAARVSRLLVYLAGLAASGAALAGVATFDAATMTLDISPFRVDEAVYSAVTFLSSGLAALAWIKGWASK